MGRGGMALTSSQVEFRAEKGTQRTQLIFTARLLCYHLPMPRRPRICPGGTCFHVINRAVARLTLFEKEADYIAFERVLGTKWHCRSLRTS